MTALTDRAPHRAVPAFLALSCVGAFGATPAVARTDSPADKPTSAATAPANDEVQEDITVNGQREKRQAKDVAPPLNNPRSVVTISSDIIKETGATTLADALRTVPGITFGAAEGGNPVGDRPFIRGFDSQGSIYVDSVRDPASQTRETFAVDAVQIVRGSDSTLGGRGSAGGTINIVSKLPQAKTFAEIDGSYGSADYKRITGDVNVKITDTVAARLEAMWHDQDVAGRDAIWQRRWGVAPSVTIGLGTPTRLTAAWYHMESHELPDSGIPYLYTIGNAPGTGNILSQPAIGTVTLANGQTGYVARNTFYGLADRDFRDTKTDQGTLRVEHDFGGVTLRNTARYEYAAQAYIYTQPDDSQGNVYGTTATNAGTNLTSGGYLWRRANTRYSYDQSLTDQLDLFGRVRTGSIVHSIAIGAEISFEKERKGTYVLASGSTVSPRCNTSTLARYYCTSIFSANPNDSYVNYTSDTSTTATSIVQGGVASETQNNAFTFGAYGFDSITLLPQLVLNLGARFDHFNTLVTLPSTVSVPLTRLGKINDLFNWQAGLVFKPTANTSLYGSYATAATPPNSLLGEGSEGNAFGTTLATATQAATDALKVTKTRSYEVGAKANVFHEKLALAVAAFQTDTTNARVTDPLGNIAYLGKTRIRGIELTFNGTILPGWTVFGGYTYLDPVVTDAGNSSLTVAANGAAAATTVIVPSVTTGKQVPQTAKNSFTLWTTWSPIRKLALSGGAIYMDRQYGGYADNRTATQTAAGVVTVNAATKVLYREIPDYWVFNARASYQVNRYLGLSVNAQNLTDKVYFTQAYASHYASIAPGRTIFGTVAIKY